MTMNNRITKTLRGKAGFTLVELIVVIAILGILAGVGTVGYSGYIKKANEAADQQLLGFVNQAFAAACLENGVDASSIMNGDAKAVITDSGELGKVTPYTEAFNKYFAGNEGAAFKVIEYLTFKNGVFVAADEVTGVYMSLIDSLDSADLAALMNSGFYTYEGLGIKNLLSKVDDVTDLAAAFDSGVYDQIFTEEAYLQSMCKMLGVENADSLTGDALVQAYDDAIQTATLTKMASMAGMTDEEFTDWLMSGSDDFTAFHEANYDTALNKVQANAAVLYAAQNANNNSAEIMALLTGGNAKAEIKDSLNTSYGTGLSNAAVAYGLYTAYAYSTGDADLIASTDDPISILNGLEDEGFQAYLKDEDGNITAQAQSDLDGYLAAMTMITSSSGDNTDLVNNLLANGFADPELIAMLEQATAQ